MKHFLRIYLLPLAFAAILLMVVKTFFVAQYVVPTSSMSEQTLLQGDRVLADLTAYNFFHKQQAPEHNALVALYAPFGRTYPVSQRSVYLSRVAALPGDTIWMDTDSEYASVYQASSAAHPFVLPRAGEKVAVEPHTAYLLWNVLRLQENVPTTLVNGSSLRKNGLPLDSVSFEHDCYWVDNYGMVTHQMLAGRILCVSFSLDETAPRFHRLRKDRFFLPLY